MTSVNRRLLILAVFLISFSLSLAYLISRFRSVYAQTTPPDPKVSGIDVAIIPTKPTAVAGATADFEIWVNPNNQQVTAAELRLNFDPTYFTPASTNPIDPGPALSLVLPNCDAGQTTPCPSVSSVTGHQALVYLGVNCTATGCPIPDPTQKFLLATLHLKTLPAVTGITTLTGIDPQQPTLTAALSFDADATKSIATTSFTVTPCSLNYDFSPNGTIDIVDIMQVAGRWNTAIGNPNYNGQFDVNHDGQIDIVDIQSTANTWNTSCN